MYILTNKALEEKENKAFTEGWEKGNSETTKAWKEEYELQAKTLKENSKLEYEVIKKILDKYSNKITAKSKKADILENYYTLTNKISETINSFLNDL